MSKFWQEASDVYDRMDIREAKMYSVPELSKILGFERHKVYQLIESGQLKGIQTSKKGHWRVIGKFLKEFMENESAYQKGKSHDQDVDRFIEEARRF